MMSSPGVWDISPLRAEMIHVLRFQGADLEVFGAHQELRVPVVVHILAMLNISQMLAMRYTHGDSRPTKYVVVMGFISSS